MHSEWVIWFLEGVVVGASALILFSKSVFHAAINLLIILITLGVLFGLFGSEFLFIAQVMIYGGGILVLILFVTMVIGKEKFHPQEIKQSPYLPLVFVALGIVSLSSTYALYAQPKGIPLIVTTSELSKSLLLDYALPLEVSGILLLASLVGAAIISIQKPTQP